MCLYTGGACASCLAWVRCVLLERRNYLLQSQKSLLPLQLPDMFNGERLDERKSWNYTTKNTPLTCNSADQVSPPRGPECSVFFFLSHTSKLRFATRFMHVAHTGLAFHHLTRVLHHLFLFFPPTISVQFIPAQFDTSRCTYFVHVSHFGPAFHQSATSGAVYFAPAAMRPLRWSRWPVSYDVSGATREIALSTETQLLFLRSAKSILEENWIAHIGVCNRCVE